MAMTHDDKDAKMPLFDGFAEKIDKDEFFSRLQARADKMREAKASTIAAGVEDEPVMAQWSAHGMQCTVRPDDPQGILRISVGGGPKTPVPLNYCTVRGDIGQCIDLLERAIRALRKAP